MTGPTGGEQTPPFGVHSSKGGRNSKPTTRRPPPPGGTAHRHLVGGDPERQSAIAPQRDIDPSLPVVQRLVIAGVPKAGKTTLGQTLRDLNGKGGSFLRHTDDLIETHSWSAVSAEVAIWFDEPGPWIIEGVATVRALRKWMKREPEGKPCDAVMWMPTPLEVLEGRVLGLAKGCGTVWEEILPELVSRGVQILTPTGG